MKNAIDTNGLGSISEQGGFYPRDLTLTCETCNALFLPPTWTLASLLGRSRRFRGLLMGFLLDATGASHPQFQQAAHRKSFPIRLAEPEPWADGEILSLSTIARACVQRGCLQIYTLVQGVVYLLVC